MTTDYNQIAEQYRQAKQQPWRSMVEEYSFLKLIGNLRGKKVVDLACGEGFFTRKLKTLGADTVVGTDISSEMIELATTQEAKDPLGIEYRVEDARAIRPPLDFDVAVSAWLLVYAHDREELAVMCRGLARQLRPGGRFVTFMTNPDLYAFDDVDYRKYGFTIGLEDKVHEGATILWTINLNDESIDIENYYLPKQAYTSALENAGFRDVVFHSLSLSPDATGAAAYWAKILKDPPAIMIEAIRAE